MKKTAIKVAALGVLTIGAIASAQQTFTIEDVLSVASKLGVFNVPTHPTLERREQNEAENIKDIAVSMYKIQMATQPSSRDAHAKGHGCAYAEVSINQDIPADYQVGLFANSGRRLDALIRFSNGAGTHQADKQPDGRGMAIKIIDGAPQGNLLGTGTTQDLMLINNPTFFIRSIKDYAIFQQTLLTQKKGDAFILGRAIREALNEAGVADVENYPEEKIVEIEKGVKALPSLQLQKTLIQQFGFRSLAINATLTAKVINLARGKAPLELKIIKTLSRPIGSPTTESYFSMSPYLLAAKSGDTAVKYSVRPVTCDKAEPIQALKADENLESDGLRRVLNSALASEDVCYKLYIQPISKSLSVEDQKSLVEDARQDFGTPEIEVGQIRIPRQTIDTPDKQNYCENLSFNPWQAGAEHRPIGSMNRARKVAVTASSIRRHWLMNAERAEPTTASTFKNLK